MLPFSSTLSSQIRFLLQSASPSTFDSLFRELCQYEEYGCEGSILLLQGCLDLLNYSSVNPNLQSPLGPVSAIFKHLLHRPNFTTIFCESLRLTSTSEAYLADLSNTLKLSNAEKVGVGLALSESDNIDLKVIGQNFCILQIEELCSSPTSSDHNEQIQDIFMFLCWSEGLSKHADSFTKILSLIPTNERFFLVGASAHVDDMNETNMLGHLDALLECSDNDFEAVLVEMEKEISMADIMRELGYGCTSNTSHCTEMLSHFLPLTEATLSRLISTIISTRTGLEDDLDIHYTFCSAVGSSLPCESSSFNTWNVDILVDSVGQLAPTINWVNVMENLDHEGFNIPDEASFSLLMSVYKKSCQDPFPLHAVCGSIWRNAEGQLSLLRHAVSARPDVFTFAHSSRHLNHSDSFQFANKEGNHAWSCLDLLEVLCQLAERGHISTVRMMLEQPLSQCPEVLLAAISQISTTYNFLQSEVFSILFPAILKDPMKTSLIHYVWRAHPNLVLRRFLDVYTDPIFLLRILDICQELKILATVLEVAPSSFGIKLATISFRKEQTALEKWLTDNLNTHKDAFFQDCLKFLSELSNMGDIPDGSLDQSRASIMSAYLEALSIFLKVLQAHSGQFSLQLSEELNRLVVLCTTKNQSSVCNADWSTDEIEAEANACFQQMFAGERSVEDMVQMLARFKESSERREQKIYECMVSNLFEEYKFFSKYPDRQLKIAAILFGLLIKHQLVTHLFLGIALRGVLDALRKSIDSKMFMFGTKALEQFMDRLVEWPQYCNHILQISHLRSTHADLVSVIERTLARVSSSQVESNGVHNLSTEMQQVSAQASVESMEAIEGSWPLIGSSSTQQFGQQPPPFQQMQPQLRHQGFLGDRLKPTPNPVSYAKPILSNPGQPSSLSSSGESVTNPKLTASQPQPQPQPPSSQHLAGSATTASPSPAFLRPPRNMATSGFGAALNIETLVAAAEQRDTPMEAPASEVQDKILFIVNNISTANMEAKAKEFTEVLKEQYYPWFAQYMVMKRASIEPNFHDLYLKFLDKVNSKTLNKEIVKATYENCKVLLRSDLIKSSSEERSLLKNLGSWLGKFTIGRNQVLRAKELDPKVLIIEAYEKGLMIAVIPFTSKILEPCQNSLAYQPPNPWTMGILSLLAEIYNLPSLKMNLKFDIEVLFKNLAVDMKDVKPTSLLKDRVRDAEANPDFSNKDVTAPQAPIIADVNSGIVPSMNQAELHQEANNTSNAANHQNALNQYTASLHLVSSTMVDDEKVGGLMVPERPVQGLPQVTPSHSPFSLSQLLTIIPNSDSYININPKLSSMGSQLQFQRIIQVAMDRAIKDIVAPVIQRSVTIASRTTKELVLKDYAMESDDNVISRAAHLMVGTLAGSLAHVTCKEPLRIALSNNLRSLLSGNVSSERIEQVVQILSNDHLDLGCAMIENVAYEKAAELIDATIGPSFAAIRKQRESAGSAYYDAGAYSQGPFAQVPEALRPKPGRLSVAQQRVYDDFIRSIWQNQSSQSTSVAPSGPAISSGNSLSTTPRGYGSALGQLNPSIYPNPQVAPSFSSVAQSLDTLSEEPDRGSLHLSDGVVQPSSEINSIPTSFPSATTSVATSADLLIVEPSSVAKEWGVVLPPTPAAQGTERSGATLSEALLTTGDALEKYQLVAQKLDALIAKDSRDADIQGVIAEVPDILLRCVSKDEAALAVAQKVFKSLYESSSNAVYVGAYLAILLAIRDVCKLVVKELTSWVIYSDEERKFNREITIGLIRSDLLNLSEYNMHIAKLIDGGRNKAATDFAISLVQALVINEPGVSVSELYHLIDALTKLAMRPGSPESLQQLIEIARNNSTGANSLASSTASKDEKTRQSKDKMQVLISRSASSREENDSGGSDPAGFREQASLLFAEWCRICDLHIANDTAYTNYLAQLQQAGLLKGDDTTDIFFRVLTELSVAHCLSSEQAGITGSLPIQSTQIHNFSFGTIDAFAKLVAFVVKYGTADTGTSKVVFLPKILSVLVRAIVKDAEEKKVYFNPRPYFRLFINWLHDLACHDPVLDGVNFQVLTSFANAFHALQPLKVPGFSFAWLELISHRSFMPKLLTINSLKGWPFFQRLLVDLFKFVEPYLRNAELSESVQSYYKGTLRVLLVLLHDFPEFLCDYHFSFCDVIPPSCIQMRNVILSAFPQKMRLPDPSTPNLKIDLLTEISQSPQILSDVEGALKSKQIKSDVDEYLMTRSEGSSFLAELKQRLLLSPSEASLAGTRYNVPLINSLVLYVGMQAIQQLQSRSSQPSSAQQITQNPPMDIMLVGAAMDIFQSLIKNLDPEGRYLFLNAVANQLRYPNNHTHYFSFVLLYLFGEKNQEPIQEQITRVLLERLIVNRPHPWGLLITFIELIKNPRYSFWSRSFTRCAPEIEKLFETVSRSCGGPKTVDDGMVPATLPDGNH
ncbi:CCR4-NOT transcription complex subunit 1 isoform X2 [Phalaenopsis equestris]|uniref:CCR4-NOT transcription complex subunit 1 isoform X2 n=1 Tax=Phalaenopsis equestris TaxID=78828 RepID=UPI0009E2E5DD|nr:CCR4-NOT transcription complex subunit 1 isoform X2 [Phalaenopsis equestris]